MITKQTGFVVHVLSYAKSGYYYNKIVIHSSLVKLCRTVRILRVNAVVQFLTLV